MWPDTKVVVFVQQWVCVFVCMWIVFFGCTYDCNQVRNLNMTALVDVQD